MLLFDLIASCVSSNRVELFNLWQLPRVSPSKVKTTSEQRKQFTSWLFINSIGKLSETLWMEHTTCAKVSEV